MNDGPPIAMSPGTLLGGRYRLEVLLSEHGGARFWRATDTVLARNVAVHVVPSDDRRAPAVLDAARRSAEVTEQHFLRVLDCDDVDGTTWVINEWGEGSSLDVMLGQGTLPPMRAAWLAREVAEAIAAAHARDLAHGRLNPESVLVTDSGSVKIIGFVVNAAFERSTTTTTPYGETSAREADVIDLAGILYAALTGRWPGIAPSALPPAPREGNHPLRPRQVRAGVPRTLDAICDRVLNKEASQHSLPIETAYEVAAALSDYVGDPAAVAPVDLPSMHDEPELPPDPDETQVAAALLVDDLAAGGPGALGPEVPGPPPVADTGPSEQPLVDPEATMASGPVLEGLDYFEPDAWEPAPPPPPFEQPVAKPLFASEDRRVPASSPASPDPSPQTGGFWPFEEEPAPARGEPAPPRRHWLRNTVIIALVLALAAAMYLAFTLGKGDKQPSSDGTGSTPTTSAPPTPVVTGAPIAVVQAGDFDPEGDPPEENPAQVPRAIDGNPSTTWQTSVYRGDARLGGLKGGVGLVLDLGSQQEVGSVEVRLVGTPNDLELYGTTAGDNNPPAELSDATRIASLSGVGDSAVFRLDTPVRTRYLVIWLTKLPKVAGGFQGKIAEITVRS
ncbi:MAG: protein kinase family protein [Marmoricola sp.]